MDSRFRLHGSLPRRLIDDGPRGNERLTGGLAILLLILLAIEGGTVLVIRSTLPLHVFIGVLLLPVVAAKLASTSYRLVRYYMGSKPYVRLGPFSSNVPSSGMYACSLERSIKNRSELIETRPPANWYAAPSW